MATLELTQNALGSAYEIGVGDEVLVRLPENPTTGFRWTVAMSGDGALDPRDDHYEPSSPAPPPGAAGLRVLRFAATGSGTVLMLLSHERSWERGKGQSRQVTLRIR